MRLSSKDQTLVSDLRTKKGATGIVSLSWRMDVILLPLNGSPFVPVRDQETPQALGPSLLVEGHRTERSEHCHCLP
jgi:hypothetical protein